MKKELEQKLHAVADFEEPKAELEQYRTPASVAAHLLTLAELVGDIEGRTVVDLGTGTGMLALGASLLSPAAVVGIDVDDGALRTARENERRLSSGTPVSWVRGDVGSAPLCVQNSTFIANPPFGAHREHRHADRDFFDTIRHTAGVSYTIHNEGSQEFVEAYTMDNGGSITHAYSVTFPLPRQFVHHEVEETTIQAELYRIEWSGDH